MRVATPLTDKQISAAKPREKEYALWDGQGLHIIIRPNGSKLWRLQFVFAGKKRLMGLGEYPDVSLLAARKKAHELRGIVAVGIDPVALRREEEEQRKMFIRTFQAVADEWYDTVKEQYRPANQKKVLWLLGLLCESLGVLPLHTMRYNHIREALRMVLDKGNVVTAHKMGGKAREILSYARRNGYIDTNPADDFTKDLPPVKSRRHAYITDEGKLASLLNAIDDYREGSLQVRYALKIMPYLALRVSELRGARWDEIDFDKALWIIPAERQDKDSTGMKMRIPHIVPLPRQVMELFLDLQKFTGDRPLCFPSPVDAKAQPISDMTLRNALRRMGYTNEEVTPHGFRHTFSSMANNLGLGDGDHIEAALAHKDKNTIRATYNHADYLDQRREMMQAWANYLDRLRATNS